jgi:Rps23 Pro-64 3,4-dihydroxylase Tpa1-like proline 4-hydroxylase
MKNLDFINDKYVNINFKKISKIYNKNKPFPHIFFTSFFKDKIIHNISNSFPDLKKKNTYEKKDINEKKFGLSKIDQFPANIRKFVEFLNSSPFLQYLNSLTGIKETLIPDPYFYGGGLHQMNNGGYLKVHTDFYLHPKMKLDRRLNLLVYLNKDWKNEYGGAIELWDHKMKKCAKKMYPKINNVCLFSTDNISNHGVPNPLSCPKTFSRNSIALYYYTNGRGDSLNVYSDKNTTNWKNRKGFNEVKNNYNFMDFLRKFKITRYLREKFKK